MLGTSRETGTLPRSPWSARLSPICGNNSDVSRWRKRREAPSLDDLIRRSENPIGLSVVILLLWIAEIDGGLSSDERNRLLRVSRASGAAEAIDEIMGRFGGDPLSGLASACTILRTDLDPGERRLVLEMAIGMAIEGELSFSQNHVLRFLADLFQVAPAELDGLYRKFSGEGFPDVGDPGSVAWWQGDRGGTGSWGWRAEPSSSRARRRPRKKGMDRAEALAVLGLRGGATQEQVKAAFRRLSHAHHPDRFQRLGPEAVEAATQRFLRIKQADDALRS